MRTLTGILLAATALFSGIAPAQEYPSRPVRVLVPFAPGGVVDTSARILTTKLSERLGWQFVVDNRPGASGFIAVQTAARGAPDGYTLLMAHTGEFAVNQVVFKSVPFELADFAPIVMVSDAPMLVAVNVKLPINSFKDLVAMARAKPGQVTFGSPGGGTINHLASEWLAMAAGIKLLAVPYKGGAPAVAAVAAGEVAVAVAGAPGVLPHLHAGRVRVIGVTTAKRTALGPEWSTPQEGGIPDVDASIWTGLFAPKGTPKAIIDRIYKETATTLKAPDVRERFAAVGAETVGLPPSEFTARIKRDAERYRKVAKGVGIEPQ
jgi:tripartite-type tricarboxylate transporter receptor subunit TctC